VVNDNCHLTENLTMITHEENELLTQTGKGTPCGELMRRYWQPAALSEELAADKPLAVQLFGEELVLFRDADGKPALIGRYCAHQGVDMIYGRVERDGLRCMYHGWLFDNCGRVVLRGEWLPEKERRWDVGQPAYPVFETDGIIFAYMAAGEPPGLPGSEMLANLPAEDVATKELYSENYLRRMTELTEATPDSVRFVMPNILAWDGAKSGSLSWLRWHVPVDDSAYVEFTLRYDGGLPFSGQPRASSSQSLLAAIETIRAEAQIAVALGERR
jgi:nitrite reductase/ring-hydroxylating ferredoxin subunit